MNSKIHNKTHVAIGATVVLITGKEKGKIGKVIAIHKNKDRVKVENLHLLKNFVKKTEEKEGGIISAEGWIHISNVSNITKNGDITKVKRVKRDGFTVFISKKDNSEVFAVGAKKENKDENPKKIKKLKLDNKEMQNDENNKK